VKVKALDRTGKQMRITGEDLLGQALEHEIDHLNGILYTDYVDDPGKLHKMTEEAYLN
jgi:peptide deformylase